MSLFEELLGKHHGRTSHGHGHGHHDDDHHGRRPRFGSNDWGDAHRQDSHGWGDTGHGSHRPWTVEPSRGDSFPHAAPLALVMRNKGLLIGLGLLAVVLLVVAIAVLAYLLPFLAQALGFVGENGIKGLLERFAPLLNLLWNGSGK